MSFFEVQNLAKEFDGVKAVDDLSFTVNKGEVTALIGPNGAGKTTAFNVITGFLRPDGGTVTFKDAVISGRAPHRIARLGIARTFQDVRLFPQMSVVENVMLALRYPTGERLRAALFRSRAMLREERENRARALVLLERMGMADKRDAPGEELSHGQRRLVEIARALALDPDLLLLDEPTAGLFPEMVREMKKTIRSLKEAGTTVLFIEHDMNVVMDISDRVIVLNYGRRIAAGTPAEIRNDENVITAYLGRRQPHAPGE